TSGTPRFRLEVGPRSTDLVIPRCSVATEKRTLGGCWRRGRPARKLPPGMFIAVHDARIASLRPLIPPANLLDELPLAEEHAESVGRSRAAIGAVVEGNDDRLLVVVGPCSIHDPEAALDYAGRLLELARTLERELCIVMRTYFEKPRTTVGWKGLI